MQFTKTAEQLAERRARVAEMTVNGQVMTSARRARIRKQQQQAQKLQEQAEMVLVGLSASNVPSRRYQEVAPVEKIVAPEATTYLSQNQKEDKLAAMADKVLAELLG